MEFANAPTNYHGQYYYPHVTARSFNLVEGSNLGSYVCYFCTSLILICLKFYVKRLSKFGILAVTALKTRCFTYLVIFLRVVFFFFQHHVILLNQF